MTTTATVIESREDKDVWPKVRRSGDESINKVFWSKSLLTHHMGDYSRVIAHGSIMQELRGSLSIPGIQLEVIAEDGTECVKVMKREKEGYLWLVMNRGLDCWAVVRLTDEKGTRLKVGSMVGYVNENAGICDLANLPRGTTTTLNIYPGEIEVVSVAEPKPAFPYALKSGVEIRQCQDQFSFCRRLTDGSGFYSINPTADDLFEAASYIESTQGANHDHNK